VARVRHGVAERPQQIRLALPIAETRHLRAALLRAAGRTRDVRQVARARRVGDVDDRGAVVLVGAGQRIARLATVMADVGDHAPALLVDRRLVRRASLQIVVADQLHVARFGAVAASRCLGRRGPGRERRQCEPEEHHGETSRQGSHG
jgi:hypothetical protein